jgi:hypothetical protein
MPIDWEKFQNELDQMVEEGLETGLTKLANKISSITRPTDEQSDHF